MGLAISSKLAALMSGRIWVESAAGAGSTFHVTVPFAPASGLPALAVEAPPSAVHDMKVLVVDDNAANRRILEDILTRWRMRPTGVADGPDALAVQRDAAAAGQAYRLVLLDAQMPAMDGFSVASQIRGDPQLAGATIMMLSSLDLGTEASRCRQLGVQAYLVKPVSQSELMGAILKALGRHYAASISPAALEAAAPRNGHQRPPRGRERRGTHSPRRGQRRQPLARRAAAREVRIPRFRSAGRGGGGESRR